MKAFFSRLHLGSKDKEKDARDPGQLQREKFPPLKSWPPQQRTQSGSPASLSTFKPLPEVISPQTSEQLDPNIHISQDDPQYSHSPSPQPSSEPEPDTENSDDVVAELPRSPILGRQEPSGESAITGRSSRRTLNGSINTQTDSLQKKVAFKSPTSPTPPSNPTNADRTGATTPTGPSKTTVSRFQATHGNGSVKEPRASAASSSRTDVSKRPFAASTRSGAASPYLNPSSQSLRSGTPYSSMSQTTTSSSRILAAQSWSEVTEEDLVSNLGARERTRQEVLFEIISSEERYVTDLARMKETFIDPLLHPFASVASPISSTPNLDYDYYRPETPAESTDALPPIAARFMSPTPSNSRIPPATPTKDNTPLIDDSSDDDDLNAKGQRQGISSQESKLTHPRSPYRGGAPKKTVAGTSVPFPSRSHHSLPPPPRTNALNVSTQSLGRQSIVGERERNHSQGQSSMKTTSPRSGMLRKLKKSETNERLILGDSIPPRMLPDDLRICLEVIDSGVFDGHKRLAEALKKRYDDQFPLVRSLADVFVSNADIFHGYATYVLHLERALEQVDNALSNVSTKKPKNQDVAEWQRVCKALQRLEENAVEKGETGLAITLSKPFQRLLKYPLLFQNLLFHTDPSTFEYESTLQMVAEVEAIVRSIEDEKIQKEERDKTRDVFARIEGLDKVRQLALPKPSRILVEERQFNSGPSGSSGLVVKSSSPPPVAVNRKVQGKSSFKRLSDVLSSAGKKDLWLVVFNDVVLQCQRTGTTSLPLVSATTSRATSMPELQGRSKYATTGRRNSHTKPRNLYKFIKIENWAIGEVPRQGVVSMDDVARSRSQTQPRTQPRIVPLPDDDDEDGAGAESDDSDRKSKMSFSYWGADKVTVQKPVIKGRLPPRRGGAHGASYGRESSANAKFGTRLVSDGANSPTPRPSSRRNAQGVASLPIKKATISDDGHQFVKATVTRPEWNTSTRPTPIPSKRSRNTSQTSGATRVGPGPKNLASPAPSEDSGVGMMYRQILAKNPSLT